MGVSFYPVLERDVPGFDVTEIIGRGLAEAVHDWGVPELTALSNFFSISPEELAGLAGHDAENEESNTETPPFPAEEWFEAEAGLTAVRKALAVVRDIPATAEVPPRNSVEAVLEDLEMTDRVLLLARSQEVRFHFAMDY